jgi:hypothetical protein
MAKLDRIRAIRRVMRAFDEAADELAEAEDEVADAAILNTVSDRL